MESKNKAPKNNNLNASIFNVTFGNLKYSTPCNQSKKKGNNKKKVIATESCAAKCSSENESGGNKFKKLKVSDSQPSEPKTPPNVRESSLSQRKTRYSNNTNDGHQDNSEYCSYITASSNSNKKSGDICSEKNKNRSFSGNTTDQNKSSIYINRRESYQEIQKRSTIDSSMINYNTGSSNYIKFKNFNQIKNVPLAFNNNNSQENRQ